MTNLTSSNGTQGETANVHISRPLLLNLDLVEKPLLFTESRRAELFSRDRGICTLCGRDCLALYVALAYIATHIESQAWWPLQLSEVKRALGPIAKPWPKPLWEGDHALPTCLGGPDVLENWRTLCIACHRSETVRLRAWLSDHSLFRITGVPQGEAWTPAARKLLK